MQCRLFNIPSDSSVGFLEVRQLCPHTTRNLKKLPADITEEDAVSVATDRVYTCIYIHRHNHVHVQVYTCTRTCIYMYVEYIYILHVYVYRGYLYMHVYLYIISFYVYWNSIIMHALNRCTCTCIYMIC